MRRFLSLTALCALCAWLGAVAPALGAGHHTATTHAKATHTTTTHAQATHSTTTHAAATHGAASKVSYAEGLKVLNDCQAHGQFTHDWTHAELEKALSMVSAMTNQYSSCSNDLHQALETGIKVKVSGGSGGGSGTTIIIIVVAVLVVLAALLGGLALRRRRQSGGPPPSAA